MCFLIHLPCIFLFFIIYKCQPNLIQFHLIFWILASITTGCFFSDIIKIFSVGLMMRGKQPRSISQSGRSFINPDEWKVSKLTDTTRGCCPRGRMLSAEKHATSFSFSDRNSAQWELGLEDVAAPLGCTPMIKSACWSRQTRGRRRRRMAIKKEETRGMRVGAADSKSRDTALQGLNLVWWSHWVT